MDWEIIAPMVMFVAFILTTGGVLVLWPISRRIGDLLELYARNRAEGLLSEVQQLRDLLETMSARMQLLEERQEFAERLLSTGERRIQLSAAGEDRVERGGPLA